MKGEQSEGRVPGRQWLVLTVENRSGKVALEFASTGGSGWPVWVGVLPLLEEIFGLFDQELE